MPAAVVLAPATGAIGPNWTMYRNGYAHTGVQTGEPGITKDTIGRLTEKWRKPLAPGAPFSQSGVFSTPTIVDGIAYVGSMDGNIHAVRISDGVEMWKRFLSLRTSNPSGENGVISSPTVSGGTVYVGADNASVWALDSSTGEVKWRTRLANSEYESAESSPMLYNGKLYIGISNGNGDVPCTVGRVVALAASDGAKLWETLMASDDNSGVGVWSTVAIDTAANRLYATTGNTCPEFALRPAARKPAIDTVPFDNSFVAMDLNTGAVAWVYRYLSGDVMDLDFGSSPVIFGNAIAALSKSGVLVAVDRGTGQSIWKTTIANSDAAPDAGGGVNSPSFADGKVLVGSGAVDDPPDSPGASYEGSFSAVDPANGRILWRVPLKIAALGASASVNGMVFTGDGNDLLALDTSNGHQLVRIGAGKRLFGGISIGNDAILVGDVAGNLHCFTIDGK